MAIKFGDLIENVNPDRAVLDLIANNAKGLLFVSDFDDATASTSNAGVAGIPLELRSPGSIVLDKTDGVLYAWKGLINGTVTEQIINSAAVTDGAWDDIDAGTTDWVQIGKVDKRTSALVANISSGPEVLNSGASLAQAVAKINELIANPPRTFGKFTAGQDVVGAGDLPAGMTALQIIERALSEMQSYDVVITSSSTIQNQQETGTNTINLTVDAPNFNLINLAGQNVEPIKFRLYRKQIGDANYVATGADQSFDAADFTSSTSTVTKVISDDFTVSGSISSFSGFEYKVEIRDNSDEADIAGVTGTTGVDGEPIRAISNELQIVESAYVSATSSLTSVAANLELVSNQPDNFSSDLRSKGNLATNVTWSLAPSSSNAGDGNVIAITSYAIQMRTRTNGTFGNFGNVTTSAVAGNAVTNTGTFITEQSGSFSLNTSGLDVNQTDGIQFRIVYTDNVVTDSVESQGDEIKFRYSIMAGFLNLGTAPVITNFADFTGMTEANIKTMSLVPGGWSANATDVPGSYTTGASYGSTFNSGEFFPRLDPNYGYNESGDNSSPNYGANTGLFAGTSNGSQSDGAFGWVHNSQTSPAPGTFPAALQGGSNTRFVVAVPDGGTGTSNLGLAVIEQIGNGAGTTTGTVFGEVEITNAFSATKTYVVSVQGSIESMNSAAGTKTPFLIKSLG